MDCETLSDAVTLDGGNDRILAGRYRILKQLGAGGMGSVWLAEDAQLDNKLFAIKMLPPVLVSDMRAYRQLKGEALVAMKLTHPNIVTLRAFEENDGNPFLVMDYIEGMTLSNCLADWGTLSAEETEAQLRPVAAAIDYAHSQKVVHRDIKPSNILVRKDGTPFVLDFGIAREIHETMTRVTGKSSGGTLLYMSPEQLNGASPKPAQDVYSFAAMAYECMKGAPPFSRGDVEFQIMNKPPEPLPAGSRLAAGVMAGLAKNPEDRPGSCTAVLEGKGFNRVERADRVDSVSRRVAEPQRNYADYAGPANPSSTVKRRTGFVFAGVAAVAAVALGVCWLARPSDRKPQGAGVQLWRNGPYWAECNIGAQKPHESGYYFWWGDTVGYRRVNDRWFASDGSDSNFSFTKSNTPTCGKSISSLQGGGWITSDGVLAPSHDAAAKHWGGGWRMPTKDEFEALLKNCDWKWTTQSGVAGYKISGKGSYASASIFLPCAGQGGEGTSLGYAGSNGLYWSSVPYSGNGSGAWTLYFLSVYHATVRDYRYYGRPVRPVRVFAQ